MIIQAALVAVVAFLASVDEQLFGASMMARPLFTGMLVGAIMGDIQTGVTVGAALEAMFMGSIMVGSAVPPRGVRFEHVEHRRGDKCRYWRWFCRRAGSAPFCLLADVEKFLLCRSGELGWNEDPGGAGRTRS